MNKKIIVIISICLIVILILGVFLLNGKDKNTIIEDNQPMPVVLIGKASNLIKNRDLAYMENILKDAKIDNVDILISWIKEFNKAPYKNCGMVDDWTDINKIKYDEAACADRWEKDHTQTDNDCRMTAFLLLVNHITMNETIKQNGTYLMFDMDAIDNNEEYKILKEKRNEFITLFNEMDITGYSKEKIKYVYGKKWKDYGIEIEEGNISLITVIMHDNYENLAFVGHAGVLIELEDKLLFIEKIAFEQPYQVSVFESKEELKDMIFNREEYFGDKTEEGPFIYENDKLLFSYK